MSLPFDLRLTDPPAAAVRAALTRAVAAANGRRKTGVLRLSADGPATLAKRATAQPEGHYANAGQPPQVGAARLALAWWTAPGGRKLVRVRGWRDPSGRHGEALAATGRELNSRPAVWHLDPERVIRAEANGSAEWVAACGCGAVGSPTSLAWAGGMCGPCRDRVDELGPEAVAHEPGLLHDPGFEPWSVGFSPDGRHVAAAGADGHRVWDARTGELVATTAEPTYNRRAATPVVGPDGRFVVIDDNENLLIPHAPPAWRAGRPVRIGQAVTSAHWTGRPGELLVQRYGGFDREVGLVTLPAGRGPTRRPPRVWAELTAVRPDPAAPRAVFCAAAHVAVCRVKPNGELPVEHRFRLGTGERDRTGAWAQPPDVVRFTADGERLLFAGRHGADGSQLELWRPGRPTALLQATVPFRVRDAAFSADGDHLFLLAAAGAVSVCHPGLVTHVRARLGWHAAGATGLAVSPDGRTLATAGPEGVKLWPVARLLEVL
ncbi:MAG: hypothetical protein C0501_09135 [Isosphaera sp.]|nr:hypothetical protein [Isosphaera sp.]